MFTLRYIGFFSLVSLFCFLASSSMSLASEDPELIAARAARLDRANTRVTKSLAECEDSGKFVELIVGIDGVAKLRMEDVVTPAIKGRFIEEQKRRIVSEAITRLKDDSAEQVSFYKGLKDGGENDLAQEFLAGQNFSEKNDKSLIKYVEAFGAVEGLEDEATYCAYKIDVTKLYDGDRPGIADDFDGLGLADAANHLRGGELVDNTDHFSKFAFKW